MHIIATSSQNKNKGLTLIEILISLAILGIILVSFLTLFTSAFSNIFSMGRKTDAANEAQAFIETVYQKGLIEIVDIANTFGSTNVLNLSDMNSSQYVTGGSDKQTFHNISLGTHAKVTIMIIYEKGKKQVKLSAIVP